MNTKIMMPLCALAVFVAALGAENAVSQDTDVVAQNKPLSASETWSDDDKNKDGYLDRKEVTNFPGMLRAFKDIDTDADDKISQSEYNAWRGRDQAM